jgi:hypothetical protein
VFGLDYHPNELAILDDPARIKVVAKGRRFGFTKTAANFVMESLMAGVSPALWVDTVYSNIGRYMDRYFLPELRSLPSRRYKWRSSTRELRVGPGVCDMRSADRPELIEGFAYKLIVLNEAGIILNDRYLWENTIRPMMIDQKPIMLVGGTPKGKNVFHELKVKAQDREDPRYKDWAFFHFTSYDNPFLDKDDIDAIAADLPESVRRQEIFAEFLEDTAGVFVNLERVLKLKAGIDPKPGERYAMGVDLARVQDFTVLAVFDSKGRMVHLNRLGHIAWALQEDIIVQTALRYNKAFTIIDSTGVGDPMLERLQRRSLQGWMVDGFHFDSSSKRMLVESLMLSIEHGEVEFIADPVLVNEFQSFEYQRTASGLRYSAPEGQHDDVVMATALGVWALKSQPAVPKIRLL